MSDAQMGNVLHPRHCRVSVSRDKSQLAFTFASNDVPPVSVVMSIKDAVGLQRRLAQTLFLLGVRPAAAEKSTKAQPDAAAAEAPASEAASPA